MIEGSEIRTIVSNDDTVVVERVDVNAMNGVAVTFHVTAIFEVRDGAITHWREYWDTSHVAHQLGIDPALMFAPLHDLAIDQSGRPAAAPKARSSRSMSDPAGWYTNSVTPSAARPAILSDISSAVPVNAIALANGMRSPT